MLRAIKNVKIVLFKNKPINDPTSRKIMFVFFFQICISLFEKHLSCVHFQDTTLSKEQLSLKKKIEQQTFLKGGFCFYQL